MGVVVKKILGISRPSASMVVAVAALGVGLAGGAHAASGFITGADIKNGSVTGADIKNGTVTFQDLTPSTRARLISGTPAAAVPGPAGPTGEAGAQGAQGAQGGQGLKGDKGDKGHRGEAGAPAFTYVTALDGSQGWNAHEVSGNPPGPVGDARLDGHLVLDGLVDDHASAGAKIDLAGRGIRLSDISALSFSERATGGQDGYNAPYLRLFTADGGRVIYSPSTQESPPGTTAAWRRHNVAQGGVRYNDEAGFHPDITWAELIDEHGDETVTELRVQAGNAGAYSKGSTAYVDDVLLAAGDQVLRYDFE
jgi:hypothetical protein